MVQVMVPGKHRLDLERTRFWGGGFRRVICTTSLMDARNRTTRCHMHILPCDP